MQKQRKLFALTHEFIADKDEAGVIPAILLGDEAEEPLLGLVVGAVGNLVERVLVHHLLRLGLLDGHAVHGDGQLDLGGLGAALGLFQLLVELELLNALLDHLDTLGLVNFCTAEKLKKKLNLTLLSAKLLKFDFSRR